MPTILVADDNSNIQKMVSLVFEEKGIRVVAVGNGEAACRKVPEVRPDLVLADVFMPVRNGYEVCEFVKSDSQFSGIPVILLVGAFDPLDEKEAQRVGANGVLKKPFVPPDPLIAMVSSWLPKTEPAPAPPPAPAAEEIPPPRQSAPAPARRAPVSQTYGEPEAAPEEFTFGTAPHDFDEPENTASAFGEPVATPAAEKHNEDEDYEEPATEWQRRRSTMDYEIPAEESSSMVERLAGGVTAPDSQPLEGASAPAEAHVPFSGANVPEKIQSTPAPPSIEWMDLMGVAGTKEDEPAEEGGTISPPQKPAKEDAPSHRPLDDLTSDAHFQESSSAPEAAEPEEKSAYSSHAPKFDDDFANQADDKTGSQPESAQQTEWPAPPAKVTPFRHSAESSPAPVFHSAGEEPSAKDIAHEALLSDAEESAETARDVQSAYTGESHEAPVAASGAGSSDHVDFHEEVHEEAHLERDEPPAATTAEMDPAAIDNLVAKLLEKLEPKIHNALSSGVLRPLVEEMLNREREKK